MTIFLIAGSVISESQVSPPRLEWDSRTQILYPQKAKDKRITGDVTLMITLRNTGEIASVHPIAGNGTLAKAATEAVKQWRAKPFPGDDRTFAITLRFDPNNNEAVPPTTVIPQA